MKAISIVVACTIGLACSAASALALPARDPRPQLYPNKHLSEVGETKANQDIAECTTLAAGYVHNSRQPGAGAKKVIGNAARGAVMGTIGGSIMGNAGRGAAAGSVMGATRGVAGSLKQQGANNPVFQQYATACLEDRGYRVLEWR